MNIHTPLFSLLILGALNAGTALAWPGLDRQVDAVDERGARHVAHARVNVAAGTAHPGSNPDHATVRRRSGENA